MKGSRFSEEQILRILREAKAGQRRRRCVVGTGSRTRPSTSMDGSWGKRVLDPGLALIDCKHLSGVTRQWRAQMRNPLTPSSAVVGLNAL
jgi:hypothetical protein